MTDLKVSIPITREEVTREYQSLYDAARKRHHATSSRKDADQALGFGSGIVAAATFLGIELKL